MVPLTTTQGLSAEGIRGIAAGREIYIWGLGDLAQDVFTSLSKAGLSVVGLVHSRATRGVVGWSALPLLHPDTVLNRTWNDEERPVVVVAAATFRRAAEAACIRAGWKKGVNLLSHLDIRRPHVVVEVMSDVACGRTACGHGSLDGTAGSSSCNTMSPDEFAELVEKLDIDLPLLSQIEFVASGDPFRHPELPDLIRRAQEVAPCTVVTSLGGDRPIAAIVDAAPARIDLRVTGFGASFQRTMNGASWSHFIERLVELTSALRDNPSGTRVILRRFRLLGESKDVDQRWRALLADCGIPLQSADPYLMPYDLLVLRRKGDPLPSDAAEFVSRLPYSLSAAFEVCDREKELPCLSQRVFPVIRADRSVDVCHLYDGPRLMESYMNASWTDLLRRRHDSPRCRECQQYALHRFDLDVLRRRHPNLNFDIVEEVSP